MDEKKTIEYPEAPSGYVTFYNYKEPFMRFEEGHGYRGVLLYDALLDKIQCHICGNWYDYLPAHLAHAHEVTSREYKERVGLMQNTALMNESMRASRVGNPGTHAKQVAAMLAAKTQDERTANLRTPKAKEAVLKSVRSMEYKNQRGTCPEQLLERIRQRAKELGRTPVDHEVKGLATIRRTFGTYNNAVELAGLLPNPWQGKRKSDEYYLELIRNFAKTHKRLPGFSDCKRKLFPDQKSFHARFGSWNNALAKAFPDQPLQTHSEKVMAYRKWQADRTAEIQVKWNSEAH